MHHDHDALEPGIAAYDREDRADDGLDLLPLPVPVRQREGVPPRPPKPHREPQRTWRQRIDTTFTRNSARLVMLAGAPSTSKSLWLGFSSATVGSRIEFEVDESRGGAPSRPIRFALPAGGAVCLDVEGGAAGLNVAIIAASASGVAWAYASPARRQERAAADVYWLESVASGLTPVPARAVGVMSQADLVQFAWAVRDGSGVAQSFGAALSAGAEVAVEGNLFNPNNNAVLRWRIRL